jgi:hypothetical protein
MPLKRNSLLKTPSAATFALGVVPNKPISGLMSLICGCKQLTINSVPTFSTGWQA